MLVVTPLVQQQPGTKWYEYENVERTVKPSTSLEQIRKVEEVAELLLREDGELQRQSLFFVFLIIWVSNKMNLKCFA